MKAAFLWAALAAGPAWASPQGLIDQPQTFPWSAGLTPVVQEEAGGLSAGQSRVKTSALWFNTYRQYGFGEDMDQEIDMEGGLVTVSAAWSPAQGWELRGQLQGWIVGGGVLDPLISGFHTGLGLPNQARGDVADGRFRDYLKGVFDDTSPAAGLTQASAGVRGFDGPWSWTAWLKPPVPAHVGWGWSDRWGGGTGVGWGDRWPLAWWGMSLLYGGSGALVGVADDAGFPGQTGNWTGQWGAYLGTEWIGGLRVLTQGSWTAVPRSGDGYLGQGAGLLTFGFQVPLGSHWTFEGSWTEEFLTWATNEVGFGAGLVWTS